MPLSGSVSAGAGLLRLAAIIGVPVAVVALLVVLPRWLTALTRRRQRAVGGPPARRSLERIAADLRRLNRELILVPSGTPVARRRGLLAAYDDVLCEAAATLEVPENLTGVPPDKRELERLRLLAALEAAGLVVTG